MISLGNRRRKGSRQRIARYCTFTFSALLGLTDQNTTLSNAYLLIDPAQVPGLPNTTLQFHGTALLHVRTDRAANVDLHRRVWEAVSAAL